MSCIDHVTLRTKPPLKVASSEKRTSEAVLAIDPISDSLGTEKVIMVRHEKCPHIDEYREALLRNMAMHKTYPRHRHNIEIHPAKI